MFPRNPYSCCYVNSAAWVSVRISLSYKHTNMLIYALLVLSLNSVFLMRILKKSRQRGKKRERTETMTGLPLSECLGFLMASLVFGFCCFCTWNAHLLSYLTICLPLAQKVPHWVRSTTNKVGSKTMQYKS